MASNSWWISPEHKTALVAMTQVHDTMNHSSFDYENRQAGSGISEESFFHPLITHRHA